MYRDEVRLLTASFYRWFMHDSRGSRATNEPLHRAAACVKSEQQHRCMRMNITSWRLASACCE